MLGSGCGFLLLPFYLLLFSGLQSVPYLRVLRSEPTWLFGSPQHLPARNVYSQPTTPICHTDIKYSMTLSVYSCLTEVCDICWIGRKELWLGNALLASTLSFQTVMDPGMAKSSWSSDHKALSRALNCSCVERELSPPRPTLGMRRWRKRRRQEEEGQEGMRGWTKWQDGWQGVGRFWHSHLREWAAGWEVSLIHSSSKNQRLATETGSWLKSGCCVWILNEVCRLILCRFMFLYFKSFVNSGYCYLY